MIEPPGLVIFDCDGVLVDSEEISNEVLARTMTAAGLPMSTADSRRLFQGLLLADIVARAERELGRPLPGDFMESYERARDSEFRSRLRPVAGAAAWGVRDSKVSGYGATPSLIVIPSPLSGFSNPTLDAPFTAVAPLRTKLLLLMEVNRREISATRAIWEMSWLELIWIHFVENAFGMTVPRTRASREA